MGSSCNGASSSSDYLLPPRSGDAMTDARPPLTSEQRRELLLRAYDQERQDERAYWTSIPTLVLSALTITVTATVVVPSNLWGVWVVAPFLAIGIFSVWVQQSAVGARRRWYMEALEDELSGDDKIEIDQAYVKKSRKDTPLQVRTRTRVRILFSNRYSWSLAANTSDLAKQKTAIVLFVLTFGTPGVIPALVVGGGVWRLAASEHYSAASIVGSTSVVLLTFLYYAFATLPGFYARQRSWEADPDLKD